MKRFHSHRKTRFALMAILMGILLWMTPLQAGGKQHRINVSLILSGHLMFGAGYEYHFDDHHVLACHFYPAIIPGISELPFAFSAGYGYYTGGGRWKGRFGLEYTMIISPPDPEKRKTLPMICFLPGLQYSIAKAHHIMSQLYLARFLKETRVPMAPIGIELRFGKGI